MAEEPWVVAHVGVHVPLLRIEQLLLHDVDWIGRHESSQTGGVVPSPEVVEAGFAVAFFAGELLDIEDSTAIHVPQLHRRHRRESVFDRFRFKSAGAAVLACRLYGSRHKFHQCGQLHFNARILWDDTFVPEQKRAIWHNNSRSSAVINIEGSRGTDFFLAVVSY